MAHYSSHTILLEEVNCRLLVEINPLVSSFHLLLEPFPRVISDVRMLIRLPSLTEFGSGSGIG